MARHTMPHLFDGGGISMFGVRFLGEHPSADLGLLVPLGVGEVVAFPMVYFVWRFGRN